MHRCIGPDGSAFIVITVAEDREPLRMTQKVFFSGVIKDLYVTTEVTPIGAGSHVTCHMTYRLAVPFFSPILEPLLRRLRGRRQFVEQYNRLKEYCEGRLSE